MINYLIINILKNKKWHPPLPQSCQKLLLRKIAGLKCQTTKMQSSSPVFMISRQKFYFCTSFLKKEVH
jgi:hypothetical protein